MPYRNLTECSEYQDPSGEVMEITSGLHEDPQEVTLLWASASGELLGSFIL